MYILREGGFVVSALRSVEPPEPRGSGAITVYRSASAGMIFRHEYQVSGYPCSRTTVGPVAAYGMVDHAIPLTQTVFSTDPSGTFDAVSSGITSSLSDPFGRTVGF